MSGREDRGGTSAPGGATPASTDSTSSASADATLEEEQLRDARKEVEEKTGAMHSAQGTSSSAPSSPSKVLGLGKNSAPSLPMSAAPQERNTVSDVAGTSELVPAVAVTDEAGSGQEPVARTRSESAAAAQGEAALAEMEQAMPALTVLSHKKMESPNLPRDFASKSPSTDLTERTNYQIENDSDKLAIMANDGQIDPMEELFRRIKSLKDNYLSKLVELDQQYTVPKLTEVENTEEFNNKVRTKKSIRKMLKFLQIEKNHVHDGLMKKFPEYEALLVSLMPVLMEIAAPLPGDKRPQQQQAQPADASSSFPIKSPEGQVQPEGAETLVAKSPLDRLREAVRSSPPEAFLRSVCSVSSVFGESSNGVPFEVRGLPFEVRASDSESSRVRSPKRQKMQNARNALREEIESINNTLVDTLITIAGDSDAGTTIKLLYTTVALSPGLKSLFESSEEYDIKPAKLSVPSDYPRRSPVLIIDEGDDELRKKSSALSDSAHAAFSVALKNLPESHSIKDIVKAWGTCVRTTVTKFARQYGGGTFSSRFGSWEKCGGS